MTEPTKPASARDDVLSFLDDLDSFAPVPGTSSTTLTKSTAGLPNQDSTHLKPTPSNSIPKNEDAQSVLDFLDEITQRSSTPTASIQTKKLTTSNSNTRSLSRKPSATSIQTSSNGPSGSQSIEPPISSPAPASSGWGWGSVLKQATSTVYNQAKTAAGQVQSVVGDPSMSSHLVKHLNSGLQNQLSGQTETARKWKEGVMEYVKASGIDQLGKDLQASGLKSLTEIMNVVVPPISEHEIIEVQLSYDMIGYDGIETLVYRSLSKVMEQVDGGDLVLNKGEEEKPRERSEDEPERDLQAVEGMTEGYKLALANLEQMIKRKSKTVSSEIEKPNEELPITHCPVFVRIQPILSNLPGLSRSEESSEIGGGGGIRPIGVNVVDEKHLFFLILLRDVNNSLDHATLTQSLPAVWLDIPFEENEWVEDVMVEVIRRGTEVIGQQYVNGRLSGRSVKNSQPPIEISSNPTPAEEEDDDNDQVKQKKMVDEVVLETPA